MTEYLINIQPLELAEIWGELVECLHGCNGYGGDTAEIYSYRLQKYSPTAHGRFSSGQATAYRQAGKCLAAICKLFAKRYEVKVTVNGIPLGKWSKAVTKEEFIFDHRVHVRVHR